jgi:cell division protease FtsH
MGPQAFGEHHELLFLGRDMQRTQDYSEETSRRIDAEVNRLLREAHEKARELITANRDKLTTVAEMLLERETIDGRDVMEIVLQGRILSESERADVDRAKQEAEAAKDAAKAPKPEAAAGASV